MTEQDQIQKFEELIKDIKYAMMTTAKPDGSLHSRPMACVRVDGAKTSGHKTLWFFTHKDSGKVKAVDTDQHVNLAYADPAHNRYVSVAGHATVVEDRHKAEEMWNPLFKAWFPKGLEDPQLALLKVSVDSAEFWDSPSSTLVQLFGFAKALATGETYKAGPKEHGRIQG